MKGEDILFQLLKFVLAQGWVFLLHDASALGDLGCFLSLSALLPPSCCGDLG